MEEPKSSTMEKNNSLYITVKYYILYLKDITNIRALPYHFPSVSLAQYALDRVVGKRDRALFKIVSGRYIKRYLPKLYRKIALKPLKYQYPGELKSHQEKKNFRTMYRRRLRRLDLYTLNNSPWKIRPNTKLKPIRHVKNKQKVADSPNTTIRVVQLEKYNKFTYLVILKILRPKRGKDLCRLKCYKVDIKRGTDKLTKVRVQNKDLITAMTIERFKAKAKEKNYEIPKDIWDKITTTKLVRLKRK